MSFGTETILTQHITTQHGVKKFMCSECFKEFTQPSIMKLHISTVYEKERPYKCKSCGRAMSTKIHLRNHTMRNTGEKPRKCKQC